MEKINFKDKLKCSVQSAPWPHFILDSFLPAQEFQLLQEKLCMVRTGYLKRPEDEFDLNFMFLPDISLAKFFLSESFHGFLEELTGLKLEINNKSLVQLRLMTPESPSMPPHVDAQDKRSLVCLLYLSPNLDGNMGGELVLHKEESSDLEGPNSKWIEPLANRMVLFLSENHHWHRVRRVENWYRHSVISEWIICERQRV